MAKPNERKPKKPGPKPTIVVADGDWTNAVGQAMKVEKPATGWPSPEEMQDKEKSQDKP